MTVYIDKEKTIRARDIGICTKCKINPSVASQGGSSVWCKECQAKKTNEHYHNMKNGMITKNGRTIEDWLLSVYRTNARNRGIQFNLTKDQAVAIMHQPCEYCKLPKAMGIDRVDSKSNYEVDTVVPCCGQCNRAKHTQSAEEYNAWLDGVVERRINSAQNRDSEKSPEKTDHVGTAEN
jgi:hypothetical protein